MSKLMLKKFGKRLKTVRLENNLSQYKLAKKSGLHRTYISGVERGIRNISLENIWEIAKAFRIKLVDLFDFS